LGETHARKRLASLLDLQTNARTQHPCRNILPTIERTNLIVHDRGAPTASTAEHGTRAGPIPRAWLQQALLVLCLRSCLTLGRFRVLLPTILV
jgi:hypothetical protein